MFSSSSKAAVRMKGSQTKNENQQSSTSQKKTWGRNPYNHRISTNGITESSILSNLVDRSSLIADIKSVVSILNGEVPGKDTNFCSDLRPTRCGIVLLAALVDPIFEDHCIQVTNFDRGTAEKIYPRLESRHKVRFLKENNNTYITLTKIGQMIYREIINHLINLKLQASIQNQLVEEPHTISTSVAKGVKIKPHRLTKVKPISDKLDPVQVTGDSHQHQHLIQI
jgi:hypothetical protein